jgi:nucleoside-diphosphate-sugar epimerase
MKKVLVTGGAGFIGRHVLPALAARGFEVHTADLRPMEQSAVQIRHHPCDLLDADQVRDLMAAVGPSHLLHLAWFAEPGVYWTSPQNLRWVRASLRLLQAFTDQGGQRVVMAGSCAEYDWSYGYCTESLTPLQPGSLYGACKHALQVMVSAFARQESLSSAWGRVFFLYGPHEAPSRLVASVIRSLLMKQTARCSHGLPVRDFLHVEDVAEAFAALCDCEVTGPVNIGSGKPVMIKDLIDEIARQLDGRDLIALGALPAAANEPPLLVANVERLTREVGWQPRLDLTTGLGSTIRWWQDRLREPHDASQ